jgi:hypothetical protein
MKRNKIDVDAFERICRELHLLEEGEKWETLHLINGIIKSILDNERIRRDTEIKTK